MINPAAKPSSEGICNSMWWQVTEELLQQQRRKSCDTALLEMREPRSTNLIR